MSEPTLPDLEAQLPTLRAAYEAASQTLLGLLQHRSKKADRVGAFNRFQAAGVAWFNAHDRVIALGSITKADQNDRWYTDRAETSVNLLHTICEHYKTLQQVASDDRLGMEGLQASPTAFANMQRLVKETHADIAGSLRDDFVKLGLPTHGFDRDGSQAPMPYKLEWRHFIVGCVLSVFAIGMSIWGFSIGNLSKDQRFILHWIFPLTSGFAAWGFAGSLTANTKGWKGFAIVATGGFAVWLLSNFLLFRE